MQKFWMIPVPPRERNVTLTSLPTWDETDPVAPRIPTDTFVNTLPIWAFILFGMGAFVLTVIAFTYLWT